MRYKDNELHTWKLLLPDATTLVMCIRMGKRNMRELLNGMATKGIPFSTIREQEYRRIQTWPPQVLPMFAFGHGYRPKEFTATYDEYLRYEDRKKEFLTTEKAILALKHGGIVWRLCIEHLQTNRLIDGPTVQWKNHSKQIYLTEGTHEVLYADDALAQREVDIICGVYKIIGEEANNNSKPQINRVNTIFIFPVNDDPKSPKEASWWPRENAWIKTGLHARIWTIQDEQFFQKRLEKIQLGHAKLYSSNDWKKNNAYTRVPKEHIQETYKELCSQFVDEVIARQNV